MDEELQKTPDETTVSSPKTMSERVDEMKSVESSMDQVNEVMNTMHGLMDGILEKYHVDKNILKHLVGLDEATIDTMTSLDVEVFLESSGNDKVALSQAYMEFNDKSETLVEFERNALKGMKEMHDNIRAAELEKMKLIAEATKVQKNYLSYIDSDEYKNNQTETVRRLKESVENVESEFLKKKYTKQLDALENANSCKFILERFVKGDAMKEADTVENQFFGSRLSVMVLEKFKAKIKRTGLSEGIYRSLFNIEEKFLPESYHPYNNFFLFYVMRFIGHADMDDPVDVLHVEAIINKMNLLKNDNFKSPEEKEEFLSLIKGMYRFIVTDERTERFKEKNTTYKLHPKRMSEREELVEELKKELGPEFSEDILEGTSDGEIRVTLHKMVTSKIEMCNEIFSLTHDSSLIKDALPFWELKKKFNEFKGNLEIVDTETEGDDQMELNETTEASEDAIEETEELEVECPGDEIAEDVDDAEVNIATPHIPTEEDMAIIEESVNAALQEFDEIIEKAKTNPSDDEVMAIKEVLNYAPPVESVDAEESVNEVLEDTESTDY